MKILQKRMGVGRLLSLVAVSVFLSALVAFVPSTAEAKSSRKKDIKLPSGRLITAIAQPGSSTYPTKQKGLHERYILATLTPQLNVDHTYYIDFIYNTVGVRADGTWTKWPEQIEHKPFDPSESVDMQAWATINPFCGSKEYVACFVHIKANEFTTRNRVAPQPPAEYWAYYRPLKKTAIYL